MKFITKYWPQITGIVTALFLLLGALWSLKTRLDTYLNTQQQLLEWQKSAQDELDAHDDALDANHDDINLLKDHDQLRLKGLLQ